MLQCSRTHQPDLNGIPPRSARRLAPDFLAGGDFFVGHHGLDLAAGFPGGLAFLAFEQGEFAVLDLGFGLLAFLLFGPVYGSLLGLLTAFLFVACLLQLAGSEGFGVAPGAVGFLFLADAAQVFILFGACR